jgi:RNA ligase
MNYVFPYITHIDEVIPHLDDNFIVARKHGYTVINYILNYEEAFSSDDPVRDKIRRECRGLVFDADGYISGRRLHKFFNINELPETRKENIDLSKPHVILEKLDGSMITPFENTKGELLWGTKMGETDTSKQMVSFLEKNPHYNEFAKKCIDSSTTPIFEWVSPNNRIVLPYQEENLILIAIRGLQSGWYMPFNVMKDVAEKYNIPCVKTHSLSDLENVMKHLSSSQGEEGVVLRFDDGHMVKVKSEWYIRLHKTKEAISSEKNVVELILNNSLDDLKSILMDEDVQKLNNYEKKFSQCLIDYCLLIVNILDHVRKTNMSRKVFALTSENYSAKVKAVVFKFFDVDYTYYDIVKYISDMILKHCNSNKKFEEFKEELYFKNLEY